MVWVNGDCSQSDCPLQGRHSPPEWPETVKRSLADAYAAQSRSDYAIYNLHLSYVEECHRLHYLQMACEKIAKAYRLRDSKSFSEKDLYSHTVFSRFISNFLRSPGIKRRYQSWDAERRQMERYARRLSAEIERLAPAVDREKNPANVEYPWVQGEAVFLPCRHHYPLLYQLTEPGGRDFLKLIEIAIEDHERINLNG